MAAPIFNIPAGAVVHIHFEVGGSQVNQKLDQILVALAKGEAQMKVDFAALQAEVARNTNVDQSAVIAIQGLSKAVDDLKAQIAGMDDPVAIQQAVDAFAASLKGSTDGLAAAIPANTTPAPVPQP